MIKNTSIIKGTIKWLIARYRSLKGSAIRFLLFLSISLLGGCSGVRNSTGPHAQGDVVDQRNKINHDNANTEGPYHYPSWQDFVSRACDNFEGNFFTFSNWLSYVSAYVLAPYVLSYLGFNHALSWWELSLVSSIAFTCGAYGGCQIKRCFEERLLRSIGFNVGKQKQPHSIDEQGQQYADAGSSLYTLLPDRLRSDVNCNTIGRCVGSWVAGPAGDIWGSIVGSCMDTFWQPPVYNNVNKKYLLDKVAQPR